MRYHEIIYYLTCDYVVIINQEINFLNVINEDHSGLPTHQMPMGFNHKIAQWARFPPLDVAGTQKQRPNIYSFNSAPKNLLYVGRGRLMTWPYIPQPWTPRMATKRSPIWPNAKSPVRHKERIYWKSPPSLVVKINTNSVAKCNPGSVAAGCMLLLQDHNGNWLVRVAQNLGVTTSVTVELWGIL